MDHKTSCYNENCKHYNCKLYQNIRKHNGEYRIEIYKLFPCDNKRELIMEEDRVMTELNANLNALRAYRTEEERLEQSRKRTRLYYKDNKEVVNTAQNKTIICECGIETSRRNIARHKKSKRHLDVMQVRPL